MNRVFKLTSAVVISLFCLVGHTTIHAVEDKAIFGTDECKRAFDDYNHSVINSINLATEAAVSAMSIDINITPGDIKAAHTLLDSAMRSFDSHTRKWEGYCTDFTVKADRLGFLSQYHAYKSMLYFISGDWKEIKKQLSQLGIINVNESSFDPLTKPDRDINLYRYMATVAMYGYYHRQKAYLNKSRYRKALFVLLMDNRNNELSKNVKEKSIEILNELTPTLPLVELISEYNNGVSIVINQSFPYTMPVLIKALKSNNTTLEIYHRLSISDKALVHANYFSQILVSKLNYLLQTYWNSKDERFYKLAKQHINQYDLERSRSGSVKKYIGQLEEARQYVEAM